MRGFENVVLAFALGLTLLGAMIVLSDGSVKKIEAVSDQASITFEKDLLALQKRITDLESDLRVFKETQSGTATTSPPR